MAKKRVDVLMLERGLAESRTRAQALIMAGRVRAGDRVLSKPGDMIDEATPLAVEQPETAYASRGGEKLAFALDRFGLDVAGLVALDVGASTGGFTDVLLRRGAKRVYAVDVGYGELAWSLREDPRVVAMERTNIRYLASLPEQPDLATIDVSFISLEKVLPVVWRLLAFAAAAGWHARGLVASPVLGRSGNREFLALWSKVTPEAPFNVVAAIDAAVAQ